MNVLRRTRPANLTAATPDELLGAVRGALWPRLALGSALLLTAALLGLALGPTTVSLDDTVRVLLSHLGIGSADSVSTGTILKSRRMPQTCSVLACLAPPVLTQ